MQNNIKFLLDYCSDKAELYNKVSNLLWVEFGINNAELSLLCTYIASEHERNIKGWNGMRR